MIIIDGQRLVGIDTCLLFAIQSRGREKLCSSSRLSSPGGRAATECLLSGSHSSVAATLLNTVDVAALVYSHRNVKILSNGSIK